MLPEWLTSPWQPGGVGSTLETALRLTAAAIGGLLVISIRYVRRTKDSPPDNGLSSTLVLLCILAAIVTEVIGNNLARAFGLVGALSIVRFRTPIEDSRDTAFVMFAMSVGMAVGSGYLVIAAVGIAVVGVVALIAKALGPGEAVHGRLEVRIPCDGEPAGFTDAFPRYFTSFRLTATSSVKEGSSLGLTYTVTLRRGLETWQVIREVSKLPGVQRVEWSQRT